MATKGIEFVLLMDDNEYRVGYFSPSEIEPMATAIRAARVIDEEGNYYTADGSPLYFEAKGNYFYMSLDKVA